MSLNLSMLTREVIEHCDTIAACTEEPGRITRTFLRPPMHRVHELLTTWMQEADLIVRRDALGNLIGRRPGLTPAAKIFVIGSPVDSVPNAGRYDGVLGVLLGIAAMKSLAGQRFHVAIDVIAFSEEEGVRFSTPYLGSAAVCGSFDPDWLKKKDADGVTMDQALRAFGLDPAEIPKAAYGREQLEGYLEVHIEQGPVLATLRSPIGIVDAIAGQSRHWLTFTGKAGHAGTQPMIGRSDALVAAAHFVTQVEEYAHEVRDLRATVGSLTVHPNAVNVIPGMVRLSLDVRHADDATRLKAVERILDQAFDIVKDPQMSVNEETILDQSAVPADPALINRLEAIVQEKNLPVHHLASFAGHDAVMMAKICPMAMLFIKSPGGISHHPDENVDREDVQAALGVLVGILGSRAV